jgi:hypothetical protein
MDASIADVLGISEGAGPEAGAVGGGAAQLEARALQPRLLADAGVGAGAVQPARRLGAEATPVPAYIHLGKSRDDVKLNAWDGFSDADLASAKACMDWITDNLSERTFWPPAEKVEYDDFALLAQNSPLADAFAAPS